MMFFIWVKFICLIIQAKSFVKQPFAVFGIFFLTFIVWFITATGKFLAISHIHTESILFGLCGLNVKKCHLMPHKVALLTIIYHDQVKAFADKIGQFLRIKLLCHLSKQTNHFIVTVDPRFSFILSLFHMLADHADHPDNSHQMVDMLMCHKNLPHVLPV